METWDESRWWNVSRLFTPLMQRVIWLRIIALTGEIENQEFQCNFGWILITRDKLNYWIIGWQPPVMVFTAVVISWQAAAALYCYTTGTTLADCHQPSNPWEHFSEISSEWPLKWESSSWKLYENHYITSWLRIIALFYSHCWCKSLAIIFEKPVNHI